MKRLLSATLLGLLPAMVFPDPASANIAAASWSPSGIHSPIVGGPCPLEVVDEHIVFDCRYSDAAGLQCSFSAQYNIHNPTDIDVNISAGFYGMYTNDVVIRMDGKDIQADLSNEEWAAVSQALSRTHGWDQDRYLPESKPTDIPKGLADAPPLDPVWMSRLQVVGLRFSIPPKSAAKLEVTGQVPANRVFIPSYLSSPVWARHLMLNNYSRSNPQYLTYFVTPIQTWAKVGPIHVTVLWPEDYDAARSSIQQGLQQYSVPTSGFQPLDGTEGDNNSMSASFTLDGATASDFVLTFTESPRLFFNGGAILELGATLVDNPSFRFGLGYEVALPDWLLWSVRAETDFTSHITVVPMVKAATPMFFVTPSVGLGLGAPVLLEKDKKTEVGIRAELDFQLGPIGLSLPFDYYPAMSSDRNRQFEFSLLWVISL